MGKQCICGNRRAFANCCEPYLKGVISGNELAPTAEALMRSRYTAFVIGDANYLLATHHANYRPENTDSLQSTIQSTQWINLIVLGTQKGQRKDKTGSVEFVAAYRSTKAVDRSALSGISQLHEKSQFVREGGQWFYTKGVLLSDYQPKKNQPCWCGSGLKFKRCHGR